MTTEQVAEVLQSQVPIDIDSCSLVVEADTALWPLEVFEAFEDGRVLAALRALLGEEQWATYKAAAPRTVGDLNILAEKISEAVGLQGN